MVKNDTNSNAKRSKRGCSRGHLDRIARAWAVLITLLGE